MSTRSRSPRSGGRRVGGLLWASLFVSGCAGADGALGPADSYLLFAPVAPGSQSPGGWPVVDRLDPDGPAAMVLNKLFADGFAAELLRTVHLAKQLVRFEGRGGGAYPQLLRQEAAEPLCLVVGPDGSEVRSRGLAVARWLRAPVDRPTTVWLGMPATVVDDPAAVQSVSGRLAAHAVSWVLGGAPAAGSLAQAYRMAMEVIAREWRVGRGASSALPSTAGTEAQRHLFADVRENRGALEPDGKTLRPAAELLADPQVAATVIYRMAQLRSVAQSVAGPETYTPFVAGPLPEGISGAAVLGPIRNFQAKLFTGWGRAVTAGHPPRDIVELLEAYLAAFPAERREVLRVFLVTTYLGTVKRGGMARDPDKGDQAAAELAAVLEEVVAGKRGLRDALSEKTAPADAAPIDAGKRRRR
jgi:hypothetical protein